MIVNDCKTKIYKNLNIYSKTLFYLFTPEFPVQRKVPGPELEAKISFSIYFSQELSYWQRYRDKGYLISFFCHLCS